MKKNYEPKGIEKKSTKIGNLQVTLSLVLMKKRNHFA